MPPEAPRRRPTTRGRCSSEASAGRLVQNYAINCARSSLTQFLAMSLWKQRKSPLSLEAETRRYVVVGASDCDSFREFSFVTIEGR